MGIFYVRLQVMWLFSGTSKPNLQLTSIVFLNSLIGIFLLNNILTVNLIPLLDVFEVFSRWFSYFLRVCHTSFFFLRVFLWMLEKQLYSYLTTCEDQNNGHMFLVWWYALILCRRVCNCKSCICCWNNYGSVSSLSQFYVLKLHFAERLKISCRVENF